MAIDPAARPVRSDDTVHFPSGRSLCIHHLVSGAYFTLNDVGSLIWDQCDGVLSVKEIVTVVTQRFEVEEDVALADTLSLLDELEAEECVVL